jgi:hypothetical protein
MSEPRTKGGRALTEWSKGDSRPLDEYGFATVRDAVLAIEGDPSIPVAGFAFADLDLRTFTALNRAGDAYHFVHPVESGDRRVQDGLATPGLLVCECAGGRYRGSCYQTAKAEAVLREAGQSVVGWIGPAEEGMA